jgi:acetyltransferase-like isoleucine patch superfamily enzyme
MIKNLISWLLWPLAWAIRVPGERLVAIWSFSKLREAMSGQLHSSNVIVGPVSVEGTRNIRIGRNARIYPGVLLETQGTGSIDIGDNVVLSRGVHIVAFDAVKLGDDCMVGEYASIRDANHVKHQKSMRDSGHDSGAIELGSNVWVGRSACVLKGVRIGSTCIVGANAVVTRDIPCGHRATGVPAVATPLTFSA